MAIGQLCDRGNDLLDVSRISGRFTMPKDLSITKVKIGAEGGEIAVGGATLHVAAGALTSETEITAHVVASGVVGISRVYEFLPDGLRFAVPVTLEIRALASEGVTFSHASIALKQP